MWTEKKAPRRRTYLWQRPDWPQWRFDAAALAAPLAEVHRAQGHLAGRMADLGLAQRDQATLQVLTQEVITTSAIEGERLDLDAVRSSVARKLGLDIGALAPSDRHVDGVVDVVLDATRNFDQPLTPERLFGWHAALFPTGYSGRTRITVAAWRTDASGPMQVVSGPVGREKVHFEAPPAATLPAQTQAFFDWFEAAPAGDAIIKAGLAHLWLVTLHPFDDGNGRLSRAVGDMALARAEGTHQRFYSFSAQIQRERKDYYDQLEATQKGPLDVTPWLHWFLGCLLRAVQGADATLAGVLDKAKFWQRWAGTPMNARQTLVLNRVLDGMEGKLTNAKWAAIANCSSDTALRDINDLLERGVLRRLEGGGRSIGYWLCAK
jgi:Fic family protein